MSKDPVQSESHREDMMETPESDSDSGNSLFLTQSVTSASRNVKRRRPPKTPERPLTQGMSTREAATKTHCMTTEDCVSDIEIDLLPTRKSPGKTNGSVGRRPRQRRRIMPAKKMELPFLKTSGSGQLSLRKNQTITNSETSGFFKCVLKLNSGQEGRRRRELSPSILTSESEQNNMEESEDDDDEQEDIRKVDIDCFILSTHERNQQNCLSSLKWKTGKCTKKSNNCQEEQEKCYQTEKVAESVMEPQDDTDLDTDGSSFNIEVSQSRKMGEKNRKSPARSFVSPHSSPSPLSPENSPFVRSLFVDHQEEHGENQPHVLVTCSQSQYLDWHQPQKIDKACENSVEPVDEMAVEETQWPCLAEQDDDETQILEDREEDGLDEHQVQDENICEGVHHEPVENEDLGSVGGCFSSSQDLFQEPNNQASPFKEISVDNDNEILESQMLADVADDNVKYTKSQKIQLSEIISPSAGDTSQERKEKGKETLGERVEYTYPSLPLENYISGSRGNDYSSPSKDILMVRQEEKTESPLFIYDGLKFLKRKKGKKTKAPEVADNLAMIQAGLGQNGDSAPHCDDTAKLTERKKVKNDGLLEEPADTLPEISFPKDSSASVQDSSVVCSIVSGIKPKKKRKKGKNDGLSEEPVETLAEISVAADSSLSVQDSSVVCDSGGRFKPKKKRKKDINDGLLEEPVETLPEISVAVDSGPSVQDSSVVCAAAAESKPKKKRKKDKNYGLLEKLVDTLPEISVAVDSGPSVQNSSVVCAAAAESKPKKKRKKDKNDGLLEKQVENFCSFALDSSLSGQDSSEVSAGKSKLKKKRKKDKNGELAPQEDRWIGVEEAIQIPCQASAPLVSIAEETEHLTKTDLSSPSMAQEVKHLDSSTVVKDLVQSGCLEPRRKRKKKKKAKERDSSPLMSEEMVAPQCSEESHSSHGTKTVKEKKQKSKKDYVGEEQVGEMATGSKNLEEPLEKSPEIPASLEIQPGNCVDLKTNDSVTPRKKKKRKRQEVEDTVNIEAPSVQTIEQVETLHMVQDSEQQAAEEDQVRKLKKKKKKKDRTHQEDDACKNASPRLRLGDTTASNTLSTRNEAGGTGEEEGLGGSESVKKKEKKMKQLENDGSWLVSHGLVYLDDSRWHNAEETTVMKETSSSREKRKENPASCLEMQLRNDANEKKKCERSKGGSSESSQDVPQAEDTIQPKEKKKKKKKKRQAETDLELYPKPVEHDACQESGSPLEPLETITEEKKKKKKKNRKDPVDRVENEGLDVVPELSATEEPKDIVATCHAKKESISLSVGELLINVKKKKKKKRVKDSDNDLGATFETEHVTVSGESDQCLQSPSAKLKKKRKRDPM